MDKNKKELREKALKELVRDAEENQLYSISSTNFQKAVKRTRKDRSDS